MSDAQSDSYDRDEMQTRRARQQAEKLTRIREQCRAIDKLEAEIAEHDRKVDDARKRLAFMKETLTSMVSQ